MPLVVHLIGNAHIDPVWLWPWQAGADEALATFRSAADRCDEYPEFVFSRGEAWLYQVVERIDPQLFDRVRGLVARGQWHVTGGQYLQPDANLPTEMGWHKQFAHGRRYFRDRFGVEPRVAYNVDTFGHPATLPDILAREGCVGYVFHRPRPEQVTLPATAFRWHGSGGAEVLAFRIVPVYVTRTDDLYGQIMLAIETADAAIGHTMCFYGVGNHGGGPTKGNIEYILANRHAFPDAELRFSTPQAFFDAVAERRDRLPVVTDELQRTFPGCYSVMHDIKQHQRHGEHLLDQAQHAVAAFVEDEGDRRRLSERVDAAWDDLLFTEFHDILAGTSIPSAWPSVRAMQGRAWIAGEEVIYEATRRWTRRTLPPANHQQIVVMNPDPAPWEGMIEAEPWLEFDIWGNRWLSDLDGTPLDFQIVQPEAQQGVGRVVFPARVPAGGAVQVLVRDDPLTTAREIASDPSQLVGTGLDVSPDHLANGHLRVDLDRRGIAGLAREGRQLLGAAGARLHLRHDHMDTWGFRTDRFGETVAAIFEGDGWTVEDSGPLRARVRTEGWLGHSWLRWTLTLHRDDPRLQMLIEVNFAERYKALQLPIQLGMPPTRWTDGLAGGQVDRQPNPAEWPLVGWSRVEVGGQHLALVTNDAYSVSLSEGVWQWTLLRSPKMAWSGREPHFYSGRDWHTDQGPHAFAFELHVATSLDDETLHVAARQQIQRPVVFDRYEGLDRPPWGAQSPRRLWTGAEQRAVADGRLISFGADDPMAELPT